jgi:hypothetical protein
MMQHIQVFEVLFLDILEQLIELLDNVIRSKGVSKHSGHQWEELHLLGLVVEQLSLLFLATNVLKLSSDH